MDFSIGEWLFAFGCSALIGAAGGWIYVDITGPPKKKKPNPPN